MTSRAAARASVIAGIRAAIPLALAALPFGLVYGLAVQESEVGSLAGASASWIVLAGAAQLSMLDLIDADAAGMVVVGTALVINARMALYSAALAPVFADFSLPTRLLSSYLITDQSASLAIIEFDRRSEPGHRIRFYLGAALCFASAWWIGTVAGLFAGSAIPDGAQIGLTIPLMFLALLVPNITNRPALITAVTAAIISVATSPLPDGLNILLGALAGIAAGSVAAK
ncbi:MAG: AzlC family ABC transporter permease [Acidobacteria bacterium]|nr:AzlC family ABC transporter permease [Acidobacteriota bacterium]